MVAWPCWRRTLATVVVWVQWVHTADTGWLTLNTVLGPTASALVMLAPQHPVGCDLCQHGFTQIMHTKVLPHVAMQGIVELVAISMLKIEIPREFVLHFHIL